MRTPWQAFAENAGQGVPFDKLRAGFRLRDRSVRGVVATLRKTMGEEFVYANSRPSGS
jgi:hypothetical protein